MNFLYTKVSTALASQSSVSDSLSHIEEQQNALSKTLDSYEGVVKDILNVGAGRQGGGMNVSGRAVDLGVASRERDNRCVFLMLFIWDVRGWVWVRRVPAVPPIEEVVSSPWYERSRQSHEIGFL